MSEAPDDLIARIELIYNTKTGSFSIAGNVQDEILMEGMFVAGRNIMKDKFQIARISRLKDQAEKGVIPVGVQ